MPTRKYIQFIKPMVLNGVYYSPHYIYTTYDCGPLRAALGDDIKSVRIMTSDFEPQAHNFTGYRPLGEVA